MDRRPETALILIGHGSTQNPDSSEPTHRLADDIRARDIFDTVRCCFWKEEPSMRDVLHGITSKNVFLVPNFISEGYFTQTIIPQEFALDGPITRRPGMSLFYCEPVGNHPSMTSVLLKRAEETAPGINPQEISLLIVGHGTKMNTRSALAVKKQVSLINEMGLYGEVRYAFMEEEPFIKNWAVMTSMQHVVVIPFFISDGLHSYQDIPVLLGMRDELGSPLSAAQVFDHAPHHLRGKTLYYGSAIGTDPMMASVILDQVKTFESLHPAIVA
jgi:sirohydrochlorin cobaltochelatase